MAKNPMEAQFRAQLLQQLLQRNPGLSMTEAIEQAKLGSAFAAFEDLPDPTPPVEQARQQQAQLQLEEPAEHESVKGVPAEALAQAKRRADERNR